MACNYQEEVAIQIGQGTDSKFPTIRICKSMNDELHVRIRDEKTVELDERGRYDIFLQLVQKLEARNTKKGVNSLNSHSERDQFEHQMFNDVMQRMMEDKNNGDTEYGAVTHIVVEGMPIYTKKYDYESCTSVNLNPSLSQDAYNTQTISRRHRRQT